MKTKFMKAMEEFLKVHDNLISSEIVTETQIKEYEALYDKLLEFDPEFPKQKNSLFN